MFDSKLLLILLPFYEPVHPYTDYRHCERSSPRKGKNLDTFQGVSFLQRRFWHTAACTAFMAATSGESRHLMSPKYSLCYGCMNSRRGWWNGRDMPLLRRNIYELSRDKSSMLYSPEGLACEARMPLTRLWNPLETRALLEDIASVSSRWTTILIVCLRMLVSKTTEVVYSSCIILS